MNRRCLFAPLRDPKKRCPNRATVLLIGPSTGRRIKVCAEHADLYVMNGWRRA